MSEADVHAAADKTDDVIAIADKVIKRSKTRMNPEYDNAITKSGAISMILGIGFFAAGGILLGKLSMIVGSLLQLIGFGVGAHASIKNQEFINNIKKLRAEIDNVKSSGLMAEKERIKTLDEKVSKLETMLKERNVSLK